MFTNFEYGDILTRHGNDDDYVYVNEIGCTIGREKVEGCPIFFERVATSVDRLVEMTRTNECIDIFGDEYIVTLVDIDHYGDVDVTLQLKQ